MQLPGQLIPAGLLVTIPAPDPALVTVNWIPGAATVIVTDDEAVPPTPVAVAVYVVVEVGLTDSVPPVAPSARLLPLLPVSVTPVALVAVTVIVEEPPVVIEVGLALIVAVGGPDEPPVVTVIVTDDEAVPPTPVAVAVYVVVEVGLTDTVPPVAPSVRLLPLLPLRVTWVAFVADTVTAEELPLTIDVGLALIVAVGGPDEPPVVTVIVTDDEAVPPAAVAVAVYVVVEVGLTETVPPPAAIVRWLPLLPVIVMPVAFVAATVKTVGLPLMTDVGLALIVTVGVGEPAAWLLTPANAGTAHGMSIERT